MNPARRLLLMVAMAAAAVSFAVAEAPPPLVYSRTIFMESWIDNVIDHRGYLPWDGNNNGLNTLFYAEYNNTGPGSATGGRVSWPGFHLISEAEAGTFTVGSFIDGGSWLPSTGVEFVPGL